MVYVALARTVSARSRSNGRSGSIRTIQRRTTITHVPVRRKREKEAFKYFHGCAEKPALHHPENAYATPAYARACRCDVKAEDWLRKALALSRTAPGLVSAAEMEFKPAIARGTQPARRHLQIVSNLRRTHYGWARALPTVSVIANAARLRHSVE